MKASLACIVLFMMIWIPIYAQFGGGSGTPNDPYLVETSVHLNAIRNFRSSHFRQIADIDLYFSPHYAGSGWMPIAPPSDPFTGSFDGNGFEIINLRLNRTTEYDSMFGVASGVTFSNMTFVNANIRANLDAAILVGWAYNCIIHNINIIDSRVSGYDFTGGLVSYANLSTITECNIEIDLNGHESVGGIVGYMRASTINNCHVSFSASDCWYQVGGLVGTAFLNCNILNSSFSGNFYGISEAGGIVGHASYTRVINCTSNGGLMMSGDTVGGIVGRAYVMVDIADCSSSLNISAHYQVGGLVGSMQSYSTATRSHASGNMRCNFPVGGFAGGISNSIITDCYSTGMVIGSNASGGFVGTIADIGSMIQNCYSTGLVTCSLGIPGGFSGGGNPNLAINCYWDMDTSQCPTSVAGEGRSTRQMCSEDDPDTYINWDFDNVWVWDYGPQGDYPGLRPMPVDNDDPILPIPLGSVLNAYPNPFSKFVNIKVELGKDAAFSENASLKIYNLRGQKINEISLDAHKSDAQIAQWNGRDHHDKPCAPGKYFVKLELNGKRRISKSISLLR